MSAQPPSSDRPAATPTTNDDRAGEVPGRSAAVAPGTATAAPPRRARGGGNWRSLILSMLVLLGFVIVWRALTPRIDHVERPAVDVQASARGMLEQRGWNVLVPTLGADWKPTSVSYDATQAGMQVWHAGYHQGEDAQKYIAVEQGRTSGGDSVRDAWVAQATSNGTTAGTVNLNGQTWERLTSTGQVTRHALVRRGQGQAPTVVVVGIADQAQVDAAAASLKPYRAG